MGVRVKTLYFSMGSMLSMFVIMRITSHLSGMDIPLPIYILSMMFAGIMSYPFYVLLLESWEKNQRLRKELEQMVAHLQRKADVDDLTGLLSRSAFLERAEAMLKEDQVWLLVIDIDHFKEFNDTHGHQTGDAILQIVGHVIRSVLRPGNLGGRLGGEEFALCLTAHDVMSATNRAELVRAGIQALGVEAPSGGMLRATVSIGLSPYRAGQSLEECLHAADLAMYAAKTAGRNQVRLAA